MSKTKRRLTLLAAAAAAAALALVTPAALATDRTGGREPAGWSASWATAPQYPKMNYQVPNWSQNGFANETVRQVVRLSTGGSRVRIRLSNRYGTAPLRVAGATIARTETGAAVRTGTMRALTFGRQISATIPAGGELTSDAAPMVTSPLQSLTVTMYLAEPTGPATFHDYGLTTTYRAAGDHRFDLAGAAFGGPTSQSWYFLTGVDVADPDRPPPGTVVAFGDSLTDGYGSAPNVNNRYPDQLAERLVAGGRRLGVVNAGISGNKLLSDSVCAGERGVARFPRDAVGQPGARTVIVALGANDIGQSGSDPVGPCGLPPVVTAEQVIEGHRTLIRLARDRGMRVIGATIAPMKGSGYYSVEHEQIRDAVNEWVRTSGEFDAVVDFDLVLRDPADPDALLPAYDFGDHLHPNDAGRDAMAAAIDPHDL